MEFSHEIHSIAMKLSNHFSSRYFFFFGLIPTLNLCFWLKHSMVTQNTNPKQLFLFVVHHATKFVCV